jgi:hypothetical protein
LLHWSTGKAFVPIEPCFSDDHTSLRAGAVRIAKAKPLDLPDDRIAQQQRLPAISRLIIRGNESKPGTRAPPGRKVEIGFAGVNSLAGDW